jgi:phosphoglycerate kinase
MDLDKLRTIDTADVNGKRVLVRADLNVPVKNGEVTDATRLTRLAPGIQELARRGAKAVIISHFGRPKNREPEFSLKPVAAKLGGILHAPVAFVPDCIGAVAEEAVKALQPGQVAVLENVRFHKGEEANDPAFARQLAKLGDIYVNDAFSAAHRAHASTEGLAHLLPAYAGPLMMEEIDALRTALERPRRPTVAIIGGAKVSTKIPVLQNMISKVDKLIIGGGMANTFYLAEGVNVGRSLAEPDFRQMALDIMHAAKERGCAIVLPPDAVVAPELKAGAPTTTVKILDVPGDRMILDVGPKSVEHFKEVIAGCRTLLWNGPLGAFEVEPFGAGTFALARAVAAMTKAGELVSVAGGGDTVAALNAAGVADDFSYVSTAGGAFLEWIEGRELPGIAALAR